jgi:serine/threonine-protein kinase HipA
VRDDLRQLWRRIAFTVLVGNTDNHLRNHGFLRLSDLAMEIRAALTIPR